ncbi:uncharacterized protein [Lepeophtheirus salmonis]|uniref:uncharacterized protein n=1 Tax=Lepeophtheirus salmonis TaxID=72036 RepID=UPI003AF3F18B
MDYLEAVIVKEWNKWSEKFINNSCKAFSHRGVVVIAAEGGQYSVNIFGALDQEVATEGQVLIIKHPTGDPVKALKDGLIDRLSVSKQRRLQQLVVPKESGDKKPSQLLHRMCQLVGTPSINDDILKTLFVQRLPTAVTKDVFTWTANLEEVATLVDKGMKTSTPSISVVRTSPSSEFKRFEKKITGLERVICSLTMKERNRTSRRFNAMQDLDYVFNTNALAQKQTIVKSRLFDRKRQQGDVIETDIPFSIRSRLFFISSILSKQPFLVDTGAELCVIKVTPADRIQANSSLIATNGQFSLTLDCGLCRTF